MNDMTKPGLYSIDCETGKATLLQEREPEPTWTIEQKADDRIEILDGTGKTRYSGTKPQALFHFVGAMQGEDKLTSEVERLYAAVRMLRATCRDAWNHVGDLRGPLIAGPLNIRNTAIEYRLRAALEATKEFA